MNTYENADPNHHFVGKGHGRLQHKYEYDSK